VVYKTCKAFYHGSWAVNHTCGGARPGLPCKHTGAKRSPGMIHNPARPVYCVSSDLTLLNNISWDINATAEDDQTVATVAPQIAGQHQIDAIAGVYSTHTIQYFKALYIV
jgi:hypothetical protein